MKKFFVFAALTVFGMVSAQAQDIWFGAKGGVNFASLNGDDTDDLDGRTSFHVGAVANIGISELFAIQPEIIYSAQGFSDDTAGVDITGQLDYINVPIFADFTIAEGFSLQGGPQFGFNISSELDSDDGSADIDDVESFDLGAGIGAQYKLPMGIFFQARYVIGFSDIIDEVDAKNSVLSVSLGYAF
jgi:hypothetical protein